MNRITKLLMQCLRSTKENILTPRVKPWVISSFLTFDPMNRIAIHSKAVAQYFIMELFVFQIYGAQFVIFSGNGKCRDEFLGCYRNLFNKGVVKQNKNLVQTALTSQR